MGAYRTRANAEMAIKELKAIDVSESDISCVYTDTKGEVTDGQTGEKIAAGAIGGVTAGAVVGGIAGLVVANGILPGLGSLFVAGPLAAMLGLTGAVATTAAGAATGAAAGGLIGALSQLGVSDTDAVLFEDYIQKGNVLVIARTESKSTREVFERTNALDIREYQQ